MEYFKIEFPVPAPTSPDTIKRLFEVAFDAGCHTEKDGGNEQCRYRNPTTEGYESEDALTKDAIAEIAHAGHGDLHLWCGDEESSGLEFWLELHDGTDTEAVAPRQTACAPGTPRAVITVDGVHLSHQRTPTEIREAKSQDLVRFAEAFYPILQPVHVVGFRVWDVPGPYEAEVGPLETHGVTIDKALDWMAIFTPETVERIGTDWLDAVDLHRHERLDDGNLLVVLTPHPDLPSELSEKLDELGSLIDFSG